MRRGEQTRQEIIRKAVPIFNQRGYDGAIRSDESDRAGKRRDLPALGEQRATGCRGFRNRAVS